MERGAEAVVSAGNYLGRDSAVKTRLPKAYRDPYLDRSLRASRVKKEARLLREARSAGVRTPFIYDIDLEESSIVMEMIHGSKVRDALRRDNPDSQSICEKIGASLAKLHSRRISHGDLTTSNMIMDDGELCLIDFSLGNMPASDEDLGVDVHLLRRAFMSAHSEVSDLFEALMQSYKDNNPDWERVVAKADEIQRRGRYT